MGLYFESKSAYDVSRYDVPGLDVLFAPIAHNRRPHRDTGLQLCNNVAGLSAMTCQLALVKT